jgi:hypothetical protein
MRKLLASLISGAYLLFAPCYTIGDLQSAPLYNVKVTLIDGKSVTGASYGMIGFFTSGESSKRVRSVKLSHTSESLVGHFTFYDKPDSKIFKRPSNQVSRSVLIVYKDYETINQQHYGLIYFWIKKQVQVPIKDILRVDTLNIIGKGFAIYQDPRLFANVKEPYLLVEDCGLGCLAKLYSEDKSITKSKLKELWDKYLNCQSRFQPEPSRPMKEVMSENQLKILIDPFCID